MSGSGAREPPDFLKEGVLKGSGCHPDGGFQQPGDNAAHTREEGVEGGEVGGEELQRTYDLLGPFTIEGEDADGQTCARNGRGKCRSTVGDNWLLKSATHLISEWRPGNRPGKSKGGTSLPALPARIKGLL